MREAHDLGGVELAARVPEELGQVVEAATGAEPDHAVLVRDRPVVAFEPEHERGKGRAAAPGHVVRGGMLGLAGALVQADALGGTERLGEDLLHERMDEAVGRARPGARREQPCRDRLVERGGERGAGHAGDGRQRPGRKLPPQPRRHPQDGAATRGEGRQALADGVVNRRGERARRDQGRVEELLARERAQDLGEIRGMPLGPSVQGSRHAGGSLGGSGEQPCHGILRQAGEHEPGGGRLARQLGEHHWQRTSIVERRRPVGADDEQAARPYPAGDELEERQGRLVGVVQVVERDHVRRQARRALEEREDTLEQPETAPRRGGVIRAQQIMDLGRPASADVRAQDLRPRPERRCAAAFVGARHADAGPAPCGRAREGLDERGLADARLALDQDDGPAAGRCLAEASSQIRELGLAPDELTVVGARVPGRFRIVRPCAAPVRGSRPSRRHRDERSSEPGIATCRHRCSETQV